MHLTGYMRRLLYALRGRPRYACFSERRALQYLPEQELRTLQFARLSSLIRHACLTTEHYREVFDRLRITPEDIRSFDDFSLLPILTRQDIQDNLPRLCSSAIPPERRIRNSSGGTTGHPVQFCQDQRVFDEMDANWLLSLSFAGWQPDDMVISIWGNPKDTLSAKLPGLLKPWLAGAAYLNAYRYGEKELEAWLTVIGRYRKVFLYGYATVLTDLAAFCLERNKGIANVAGVITTAEQLYPAQRQAMETAFGCKVHDQYGAREVPGVAAECECGHMHLFTHAAYAEFLPFEEDAPGGNGVPAPMRIVLSDLNNYAMPLLRYEIGDLGAPLEGPCPCGRGFPRMRMGVGRIGATLLLPEGGRLYSTMFIRQMYTVPGVQSFQFRQVSLRQVRLYIVRGNGFDSTSEAEIAELKKRFPISICPGAELSVHYVEELPRTQGGKHRQVVCEVRP